MVKNIEKFLITLNNDLWDLMGIEAGSDFLNEDETTNSKYDAYVKAVDNELKAFNINKIPRKIYKKLEDINYHTMNRALIQLNKIK